MDRLAPNADAPMLFLSHATEDKDEIARPLRDALAIRYPVWWDEDLLKAGDSLFVAINAGLAKCDFGVIVLSPAYLAKKWTQAEIAGLFSLETTTRKVLVPVWHHVTKTDVEKVFPIMADRWAPSTTKGLAYVVDNVISAVEAATKQREVDSRPSLIRKILAADAVARKVAFSESRLRTPKGVETVRANFLEVVTQIAAVADGISAQASQIKFRCERGTDPYRGEIYLQVHTSPLLTLVVTLQEMFSNDATSCFIRIAVVRRKPMYLEDREAPEKLDEQDFRPFCEEDDSITWITNGARFGTVGMAEHCLELLHETRERLTDG